MTLKNIFLINLIIGVLIKVATLGYVFFLPGNSQGLIVVGFWTIFPPLMIGALLIIFSAVALMSGDHHKQMLLRFDALILLVASLVLLAVLLIIPFNGATAIYSWAWILCLGAALIGYSAYVVNRAFGRAPSRVQESDDDFEQ